MVPVASAASAVVVVPVAAAEGLVSSVGARPRGRTREEPVADGGGDDGGDVDRRRLGAGGGRRAGPDLHPLRVHLPGLGLLTPTASRWTAGSGLDWKGPMGGQDWRGGGVG